MLYTINIRQLNAKPNKMRDKQMNILHIDCSARYEGSVSRELAAFFVNMLLEKSIGNYDYLDLALNPPQVITELHNIAMYTPDEYRDEKMKGALKASDAYVDQLLAAELIIIAAPMYNFGIPGSLKLYFDMIIRLGRTFYLEETGNYKGVLGEKKFIIIGSYGADYRENSPMAAMNCYEPHLRYMLKFIGVDDPDFVVAQPTQFAGVSEKEASIKYAKKRLMSLASGIYSSL